MGPQLLTVLSAVAATSGVLNREGSRARGGAAAAVSPRCPLLASEAINLSKGRVGSRGVAAVETAAVNGISAVGILSELRMQLLLTSLKDLAAAAAIRAGEAGREAFGDRGTGAAETAVS